MTPTQKSLIKSAWNDGYYLPDTRPIYEWAADNVILPQMYVDSGRFSVEPSRYMLRAFDAIQDKRVREVDILKGVQTGGTLVSELATIWFLVNQPGPVMWTFHNDSTAKKHCKSRWNPLLNNIKQLRPQLERLDRHSKNIQEIYFGPYFIIVNAANLGALQSISIRYKINDEVWHWDEGMLSEARGRITAFEESGTSKFINISQAGKRESDWSIQWDNGTREDWGFECDCGKPVALLREHGEGENRAGLAWDFKAKSEDSDEWIVSRCAETAHYVCPHCGKDWDDTDHTRGVWNKRGLYIPNNEDADPSHVSLRWNALVRRPMWQLVKELVEAENLKRRGMVKQLEECLQKRFAEFTSEETFADVVEIISGDYEMHDYFDGELKLDGEVARFMTIDRQLNRYYALVRGYRADGSSRLLWATQAQTIEQVHEIQQRLNIPDWRVGLDSSFQTEDCYRICAKYKWIALEGSEGAQEWAHKERGKVVKRFYSQEQRNKTDEGICVRHLFGGERIKDMLGRFREMPEYWQTPTDPPDEYTEAISKSETKREIINKRTGRSQYKWVKVSKHNHYWDCEVMNLTMAMRFGVIASGSTAPKPAPKLEAQQPEPAKEPAQESFKEQKRRRVIPQRPGGSWATNWNK